MKNLLEVNKLWQILPFESKGHSAATEHKQGSARDASCSEINASEECLKTRNWECVLVMEVSASLQRDFHLHRQSFLRSCHVCRISLDSYFARQHQETEPTKASVFMWHCRHSELFNTLLPHQRHKNDHFYDKRLPDAKNLKAIRTWRELGEGLYRWDMEERLGSSKMTVSLYKWSQKVLSAKWFNGLFLSANICLVGLWSWYLW